MNLQTTTATILATLLTMIAACADDKLVSVDKTSSTFTVDSNGSLKVYRAKPFTDVTLNGTKVTLDQLRPGMLLAVTLADPQTASRIAARGAAAAATPDPNKPLPFFEKPVPPRNIRIRMRLDGHDRIRYRDGKLWIEHVSNGRSTNISINGVEWKPTWNGDTTEPFTAFNPQPVPLGQSRVTLKQLAGRSQAQLEKPPKGANFENIATIVASDPPGGDDIYEFLLSW